MEVAVVAFLPGPATRAVAVLQRAASFRGSMPPHVTIVPPLAVPEARLGPVQDAVARAAAGCPAAAVTLGPPATFAPPSTVVHLPVTGPPPALEPLRELNARLVRELGVTPEHPFAPHVTLCHGPACLPELDALRRRWPEARPVRLSRLALVGLAEHDGRYDHRVISRHRLAG